MLWQLLLHLVQREQQAQKMRSKINYQLETDRILAQLPAERTPTLFLHACCAPCSSYVLEYLSRYFAITLFFYNPNISPEAEYLHRKAELCRLVQELPLGNPVTVLCSCQRAGAGAGTGSTLSEVYRAPSGRNISGGGSTGSVTGFCLHHADHQPP